MPKIEIKEFPIAESIFFLSSYQIINSLEMMMAITAIIKFSLAKADNPSKTPLMNKSSLDFEKINRNTPPSNKGKAI